MTVPCENHGVADVVFVQMIEYPLSVRCIAIPSVLHPCGTGELQGGLIRREGGIYSIDCRSSIMFQLSTAGK